VLTDPWRDVVLQRVRFVRLQATLAASRHDMILAPTWPTGAAAVLGHTRGVIWRAVSTVSSDSRCRLSSVWKGDCCRSSRGSARMPTRNCMVFIQRHPRRHDDCGPDPTLRISGAVFGSALNTTRTAMLKAERQTAWCANQSHLETGGTGPRHLRPGVPALSQNSQRSLLWWTKCKRRPTPDVPWSSRYNLGP
jgi:hypothetical protein